MPWIKHVWVVLRVESHWKVALSWVLARSKINWLRSLLESRHSRREWSCAFVCLEKKEVIGRSTSQRLLHKTSWLVLTDSRPLLILLLRIFNRSSWSWAKETRRGLSTHNSLLSSDFLGSKFLLDKRVSLVASRSWSIEFDVRMNRCKLLFSCSKCTDWGLPTPSFIEIIIRLILLWTRSIVRLNLVSSSSPEVVGSVCSSAGLKHILVGCRPDIRVLVQHELTFVYLGISAAEELQEFLLRRFEEVTLLEDVLVGSWLDFRLNEFLLQQMGLFLYHVLCFCLYWQLLHELTFLIIERISWWQQAAHHVHADWILLLVVVTWTWILKQLPLDVWLPLRLVRRPSWCSCLFLD